MKFYVARFCEVPFGFWGFGRFFLIKDIITWGFFFYFLVKFLVLMILVSSLLLVGLEVFFADHMGPLEFLQICNSSV